mgnify:CR=1 FL=1
MAAKHGRDFLLKTGTGAGAVTVAAMTTTSFSINSEVTEATTKDSPNRARELLEGTGVVSMSVTANGILQGGAAFGALFTKVKAGTFDDYTIVFNGGDTISGAFQITTLDAAGEMNGAQTYNIALENAGDFNFTAAA